MATKSIITRIKNKVDNYQNWTDAAGILLDGEIAIVRVPTGGTFNNPVTGKSEPIVELLMKVGNGTSTFDSLPWLSAKASDVYSWAKKGTIEEVPVTINGAVSTISEYLAKVNTNSSNISTNAEDIAANLSAINTLKGSNTTDGSVAKAIKDAIDALDYSTSTTETSTSKISFVTAVTQSNGKIAVKKRNIIEADLPDLSANKIKVDANTTLSDKLSTMAATIAANTDKLTGHTDAAINTLIDNKISMLDVSEPSASGTSTSFIKTAKQENGKIVVTKANLPSASTSVAGIVKLGVDGGAAKYSDHSALESRVTECESDIAALETAIAGGVHFRGTVTVKPTSAEVTVNGSTSITAVAGDVVIWSAEGIEYIYTGSAWEELGDVTRLGDLETKLNNLDVSTPNVVATTHKFVSQVTQTDGKVAVTYTQPVAADVLYASGGTDTIKTKIDANAEAIAAKAAASHTHGNISNDGKITSTAVTTATGILVYDSSNKIQRATAANARTIIGAGTSNLTLGTTATTAAAGNHTHSGYETRMGNIEADIAGIESNYVKVTGDQIYLGSDVIIFDCGGAPTV